MQRFVVILCIVLIMAVAVEGLPLLYQPPEIPELSPPAVVTAQNDGEDVLLQWQDSPDADAYYIYRKGDGDPSYAYLGVTTETQFTDTGCIAGQAYVYKVYPAGTDGKEYRRAGGYTISARVTAQSGA